MPKSRRVMPADEDVVATRAKRRPGGTGVHAGAGHIVALPDGASVPSRRTRSLPAELTSFVGRRREIAQLTSRIATHRLITLTGPGGSGKSRLARRVAAGL